MIKFSRGHYKVTQNAKPVVHGNYTIKAKTVSLTDTGGPGKCRGTGKYKFKLTGSKLKFTKISDPSAGCVGRVNVLTHKFTKVS